MTITVAPGRVSGRARAPASKSSMQRAVACAALAEGTSCLRHPSLAADSLAALGMARALGASVEVSDTVVRIHSPGVAGLGRVYEPDRDLVLDAGESGLALRMFLPVAALFPGRTRFEVGGSLGRRPVTTVEPVLAALGARCATSDGRAPVIVEGPLSGGEAEVDASESSQFLSGLLLALPLAPRDSLLRVRRLVSGGYVALTARTMAAFGIAMRETTSYDEVFIEGGRSYRPADFEVEGDWSGAAFLLVAAALAGDGLEVEGLDKGSLQPDRAILEALALAGARATWQGERAVAGVWEGPSVHVASAPLRAFSFDATDCPDLFPPLAVLATACEGVTELLGARRLASKESDRAASLVEALGALGARIRVEDDRMLVEGGPLHGGSVDARGDHRIAMAAALAALRASAAVRIVGADAVRKSWPSFFEDLEALRA